MKHIWTDPVTTSAPAVVAADKRAAERKSASLQGRLMWKDQRGTTRFATVVTKDVSEFGVFVECHSVVSIPLYRLVQFQLERDALESDQIPASLRSGRVLSAVYRVSPPTRGGARQGFALRLMVDPKRSVQPSRAALTA